MNTDRDKSRLSSHLAYDSYGQHQVYQQTLREQQENQYSDTFLRKTVKFWVLPSNFIAVKQRILRHIPEWRYDGKISPSLSSSGSFSESIYWDTDSLSLYNKRILQYDGSMLFRYRWYGNKKCKMGFMEQKIRKESWRGEASIKQRFQLNPNLVHNFLKSGSDIIPLKLPFIDQMFQDTLKWDGSFKHTIRTEYRRTVYQESNGADLRMSFDEDVILYDISGITWKQALNPQHPIPKHKQFCFPLGILEVKLAFETFEQIDSLELPDFVYAMINSGLIIQIDKFSKYCTGVAVMNIGKISRVPSWIKAVKQLMQIELAQREQEWLGLQYTEDQDVMNVKWDKLKQEIEYPRRREPRAYLANERTFIKWTRMVFLSLFVGFALLGFQYEPITGVILIIFSLAVLVRAYIMYKRRLDYLIHQNFEKPFYDSIGVPLLLALFVLPLLSYLLWMLGVWNIHLY